MVPFVVGCFLILLGIFAALAWRFDKERGNTCLTCRHPNGCNGNCNQGRNCKCERPISPISAAVLWKLLIVVYAIGIAGTAALLEFVFLGSVRVTEVTLAALAIAAVVIYLLRWLAEKAIDAVNWITRYE